MSRLETMTMIDALNQALSLHMARDVRTVVFGEDVGHFGGVFRVTQGLQAQFGSDRVFDTPLAECGIVGTAIGMAVGGLRPVAEIQFGDYVFPGINQIINEMAKYRYRSGGQYAVPMMVRMPYGGGIKGGHYHSQSPEAYFVHTPGLRVLIPSTPFAAKGLLLAALNSEDPVIFLEPKKLYRSTKEAVPLDYFTLPIDQAVVRRVGEDVSVLAYGAMVPVVQAAADQAESLGYSVEVIDLQSLLPYDIDTLEKSVLKTGRVLVVHEAPQTGGIAGELIAAIQERCFDVLRAPAVRVCGFDTPFPYTLEDHYLPSSDRVLSSIVSCINY